RGSDGRQPPRARAQPGRVRAGRGRGRAGAAGRVWAAAETGGPKPTAHGNAAHGDHRAAGTSYAGYRARSRLALTVVERLGERRPLVRQDTCDQGRTFTRVRPQYCRLASTGRSTPAASLMFGEWDTNTSFVPGGGGTASRRCNAAVLTLRTSGG